MKRTLIAFIMSLLSSSALAQTTPQCSSLNSNPPVADVQIIDSREHSSGEHTGSTGNGGPNSSSITGSCTYTNPSSGNTCLTTCGVAFNPGTSPILTENGTLSVEGSHQLSFTATGGSGSATCNGSFGLTVTNPSDKTPQVFTGSTLIGLTCPAKTVPTPTPTPIPTPPPPPPPPPDPTDCPDPGPICFRNCPVGCPSPIIIDAQGEGFHLTSASDGVMFDIAGNGTPIQIAWTDVRYHNAFLALPGPDGLVHNGKELFGNFTPQPPSAHPNGFIALAQYDKPENGGNGDGVIDDKDEVFSKLRLWIDENHDGICQPNELYRLPDLGIYSLALGYFESDRTDKFGNQFRYKARVNPGQRRGPPDETSTGDPGRWAYDVFFVTK